MNRTIESFYQEIGAEALEIASPKVHGNLVVYAKVEDGLVKTEVYVIGIRGTHALLRTFSQLERANRDGAA